MKKRILSIILCVCMVLMSSAFMSGCGGKKNAKAVIKVYNWGEYIADGVLDQFYKETGIYVEYDTFVENEAMYTKVKNSGDDSYDVVVPSDYMVKKMADEGMLHELNYDNIPNIENVDPKFTQNRTYDKDGTYSVPYLWQTVGILYNKELTEGVTIDSMADMFDYEHFSGKICMLDSIRDTIGMTLKMLGYSMNDTDPAHIKEAKDKLLEQKQHLLALGTDDLPDKVCSGSAALAMVYSGDGIYTAENDSNVEFVIPNEGSNLAVDCFVVLKTSKHTAEAEQFINFMLRSDIAKRNSEETGYSTTNIKAKELMDPEMLADKRRYPDETFLDEKCEEFITLNNDDFNRAWDEIKAGL